MPVLVMAAGMLGVLPLTGVVTPFLSYGGSAMVANFVALGLLVAADRDEPAGRRTWRRFTCRCGGSGASPRQLRPACVIVAATVQTLRADDYLVRPQLGVQADGGRRFQYNPRVLEALRIDPARDDLRSPRPAARQRATRSQGALIRTARRDATRARSRRALLSGGPAFVSRARRREHASELERVEHVLRRARCRGSAARLRRSRDDGRRPPTARAGRRWQSGATTPRWSRSSGIATSRIIRTSRPILARSRDVRVTIDARLQLGRGVDPRARRPRHRRAAKARSSSSTPTPARCSPASAIPGLRAA